MNDSRVLRWAERAAFGLLALLAIAGAVVAFIQSYRGLYEWAIRHDLTGFWARTWPAQVDVFIAAGELALFVAIIRRWGRRDIFGAAIVTCIGLAVSVAANVGHLPPPADWMSRATAAIPPTAATAALAIGLAVLKKATTPQASPEETPQASPVAAPQPRQVARQPAGGDRAKANDKARQLLIANPGMRIADVASQSGRSERTVSRIRSELASVNGNGEAPQ